MSYSNGNSNGSNGNNGNNMDDPDRKLIIDNGVYTFNIQATQEEEPMFMPTPHYRRLTFISMNACDFCNNVENPGPYLHYLSFETKNGWASCANESCKQMGRDAVEDFIATKAYGRANHLKNRPIKIKRTSGQMDDDWVLERSFPEVQTSSSGEEKVCVTKPSEHIEKWVSVNNLLSWNTE
jgi:hypothetical protein